MFKLIQRSDGPPYRFVASSFDSFADAQSIADSNSQDYVIEKAGEGMVPRHVIKYRLGEFEMG